MRKQPQEKPAGLTKPEPPPKPPSRQDEIDYLKKEIKLMDAALMDLASLPTVEGRIAREHIKRIRKELGLCEHS